MPKETYFNLPQEKQSLIRKVALDEFAEYSFDQASINRIVANSGIAKGSFYQYFEDKKDLFLYIVQLATEEKLKYMSPLFSNPDKDDFFNLIRKMFVSGFQFAKEHPQYAKISKKILENKDAPITKQVMANNLPTAHEIFETLLENAVVRGDVRPDIDIQMFAYLLASMTTLVIEYHTEYIAEDYDAKMFETIDKYLDFLKNGVGK